MAGRDPILPGYLRAKAPSGLRGSRPATIYAFRSLVRYFAAYQHSRSCLELFKHRLSSECLDHKGSPMPLLKSPETANRHAKVLRPHRGTSGAEDEALRRVPRNRHRHLDNVVRGICQTMPSTHAASRARLLPATRACRSTYAQHKP